MKIPIVYGSVRSERSGLRVAKFIVAKLKERGHSPVLIDPKEYNLPLLDKMYKEYEKGNAPENLEKLAEIFRTADGVVIATAEYNHGFPPALKNLLDHFLEEYFWKPSAIVSYSPGPFGGVRAATHWRDTLCEMGMPSIPSSFAVSGMNKALDENGVPQDEAWDRRIKKFLDEFDWYMEAFKSQRDKGIPY